MPVCRFLEIPREFFLGHGVARTSAYATRCRHTRKGGKGLIHSLFDCSAFDAASFFVRLRLDLFGPVASADKPEHLSKGWEQGQKEAERWSNMAMLNCKRDQKGIWDCF